MLYPSELRARAFHKYLFAAFIKAIQAQNSKTQKEQDFNRLFRGDPVQRL
jgi:hypothetical protein